MRGCAGALLLLWAGAAGAHPIEPLLTGAPMPVPRDYVAFDAGYSILRTGTDQDQAVPLTISAGIGGRAEISVGASWGSDVRAFGPVTLGGKYLALMEGPTGIDVALAADFSSAGDALGSLLVGRSLMPGVYLQATGSFGQGASVPTSQHTTALLLARPGGAHILHEAGAAAPVGGELLRGAAALQWAPRPHWIPTLEAQLLRTFTGGGGRTDVWVAPELIYLIEINHLAIKAALPVGLQGTLELGVIASLDWEG
jgi:hypothetical protein